LSEVLGECDDAAGTAGNRVYYFSTPPRLFGPIALSLGKAGLNWSPSGGFVRAVIEKPFGWDEESARELYVDLSSAFDEEQIFRIDHYLAKETVQNLLALRFANSIFEPIWNRTWVDNVQITVAETLGVGDRGGFYETTGAMRDIVQNHVLQVLSLLLMEPPTSFHPEAIRDEKVKLLRAIRTLDDEADIAANAVRGQYTRGGTRDDLMPGYRDEPGVDPLSFTETFVALRLDIDNWRWTGVPVYVRTGKRLPARTTEVAMEFRHPPQLPLFPGYSGRPRARRVDRVGAAKRGAEHPIRRQGARPRVPSPEDVHGLLIRELRRASPRRLRAGHPRRAHRRSDTVHPRG
jgi:glucose-6-phosphate 1-dehydrogenase